MNPHSIPPPAAPTSALTRPRAETDQLRTSTAIAFGHALRAARRARGLSQEALAQRAGLDRTYPSLLERGLRTPTLGTLIDLAAALSLRPEQLVTDALARLGVPTAARPRPAPAAARSP